MPNIKSNKPRSLSGGTGKKARQKYQSEKGTRFPRRKQTTQRNKVHQKFLENKKRALGFLREALSRSYEEGIKPVVRSAIIKLNKLPFLYTRESGGDRFETRMGGTRLSVAEAKRKRDVKFVSAFVNIQFDTNSAKAREFRTRLLAWIKKSPNAFVELSKGEIEVIAQVYELEPDPKVRKMHEEKFQMRPVLVHFDIPSREVDVRIAESKRFFTELEKFVDQFL